MASSKTQDALRRDRGRLGRLRRLGGQAPRRGRREASRSSKPAGRIGQRTSASTRPPSACPTANRAAGADPPTRPIAEGLLRLQRVQLRLVRATTSRSRTRRPTDKPFSWQGRMRVVGGRTNVWGRQSYRLQRPRLQGRLLRRLRRRLAARATRTSRPTTTSSRTTSASPGIAEGVDELPDSQFQPPMALTCAETRAPQAGQGARWAGRSRSAAPPTSRRPINGRAALPLLRALRARLRHALLLQLRLHDRRRRDGDRQLHARPERDGLQGADRPRHAPRDGRALHRPRHARGQGDPRPGGRALRAGARVGAHPLQLRERASTRTASATRAASLGHYLMDHLWVGGRRRGRVPRARRQAHRSTARSARTAST